MQNVLIGAALVASAFAAPHKFQKRGTPSIANGFSTQQVNQLNDAFRDALELASYTVSVPSSFVDPIFAKYFNTGDHDLVNNVFKAVLGGDPNSATGNSLLSDITIAPDYPDSDGDLACDGETMAEMRDWDTDKPTIVVCDPAGFGHGGIGKSYGSVSAVGCDSLDDRVSWKMETLGSILLHEYTHWKKLVAPPLPKETDDDAYGPTGTRGIDKSQATNNADSYSWFANENLWSTICSKQYGDPTPDDDKDPNCNNQVCTAPKKP